MTCSSLLISLWAAAGNRQEYLTNTLLQAPDAREINIHPITGNSIHLSPYGRPLESPPIARGHVCLPLWPAHPDPSTPGSSRDAVPLQSGVLLPKHTILSDDDLLPWVMFLPPLSGFFLILAGGYAFIDFRGRGRKAGGDIDQLLPLCIPIGDQTCNPGTCPDEN